MKCIKCSNEYPSTKEFFREGKNCKLGVVAVCKECDKKRARQYRLNDIENKRALGRKNYHNNKHKTHNKERNKKYLKEYYLNNKKRLLEYEKKYQQEHKEHIKKYLKEYRLLYDKIMAERIFERKRKHRQAHPQLYAQRRRGWYKNNPDKARIIKARRRTREKNVEAKFDLYDWQRCIDYFDNKCAYCDAEKKLQQDHFIALNNGGEYTWNNIVPACKNCNSGKMDFNFFIWYPKQKFYSIKREKKILRFLDYNPQNQTQQLKLVL